MRARPAHVDAACAWAWAKNMSRAKDRAPRECPSQKLRCDLKGAPPVQATILKPRESAGRPDLKAVVPTPSRTLKAFSRAAAQEVAMPLPRQVPAYASSATSASSPSSSPSSCPSSRPSSSSWLPSHTPIRSVPAVHDEKGTPASPTHDHGFRVPGPLALCAVDPETT